MASRDAVALLLVGGGKMGGALLKGWLAGGYRAENIILVEPNPSVRDASGVRLVRGDAEIPADFKPGAVIFAVKPQAMDDVVSRYRRFAAGKPLFISIAAGTRIAFFARALGADAAILRVMPNTPAAIGRGISALIANANATAAQKSLGEDLLRAVGETVWLGDEAEMDAVTAVSGSGPAYVFHLVECMAEAGREAGLPADLAMCLARATVSGAGELLRQSDEAAAQLRKNVTSPGGTTEAALKVLMAPDGVLPLYIKAIAAATRRGRELAR
ncbi:MAG: pyrroline-5-carboxylate reductase [Alphaproteobacteria bacterium]